jgi:hypothetical protein
MVISNAKGYSDAISEHLLAFGPQADDFSLHGISKKSSSLAGQSSSEKKIMLC